MLRRLRVKPHQIVFAIGIIAALLAQGASASNALLAGVYLHGAAADDLVATGAGPIGLTAGEVALAARKRINR